MCGGLRERLRRCCGRLTVDMGPLTPDTRSVKLWQAAAAEALGTLFFVLLGCGTWIETAKEAQYSHIRIALTFGLLYGILMYILRYISGGHVNPAVTFALLARRQLSILRAVIYLIGQCIGAVLGAAILVGLTPATHQDILGATMPQNDVTPSQAFGVEFMGTFFFVFVIVAVNDRVTGESNPEYLRPVLIGLTLVAVELFAIPISGGSINPARSLGPAVVKVEWKDHWIYWFGPILGAVAGALLYDFIFASSASLSRVKKCMMANENKTTRANDVEDPQTPEETEPLKYGRTPSPKRDQVIGGTTVLQGDDDDTPRRKHSASPPPKTGGQ